MMMRTLAIRYERLLWHCSGGESQELAERLRDALPLRNVRYMSQTRVAGVNQALEDLDVAYCLHCRAMCSAGLPRRPPSVLAELGSPASTSSGDGRIMNGGSITFGMHAPTAVFMTCRHS
jgi:hypothetical protein